MATVEVTFTPLPVHVRTARLVATAVARRSGVPESLLDEVRLAVGEACSRAVEAHLRHCPEVPIRVALTDDGERFEVVVTDAAPGSERDLPAGIDLPAGADFPGAERWPGDAGADRVVPLRLPDGVGLAVIAGLADDFHIAAATHAGPGTSVTMSWKRRGISG
jgi:serine/threonine-protein kinase RsbW